MKHAHFNIIRANKPYLQKPGRYNFSSHSKGTENIGSQGKASSESGSSYQSGNFYLKGITPLPPTHVIRIFPSFADKKL